MNTYICILRGINVSGQKIIRMEALRSSLSQLGFSKLTTYIQSGNIVFQYKTEETKVLEELIHEKIKADFGFDVPVLVITGEKLRDIISGNVFTSDPEKDTSFLHVTFLAQKPVSFDKSAILAKKTEQEEIVISDEAVYLFCPDGYGKTKLNNNFIESQLKVTATNRNWKTTLKLLELASCNEH